MIGITCSCAATERPSIMKGRSDVQERHAEGRPNAHPVHGFYLQPGCYISIGFFYAT